MLLQPEYCPILSNEAYSMFLADLAEFCQDYKIPDTKRSILSQIFIREVHRSYQLLPPGVISDEVLLKKWRSEIESRIKARMVTSMSQV